MIELTPEGVAPSICQPKTSAGALAAVLGTSKSPAGELRNEMSRLTPKQLQVARLLPLNLALINIQVLKQKSTSSLETEDGLC